MKKKQTTRTTGVTERLYDFCIGEYVAIVTKLTSKNQAQSESELSIEETPVIIVGYFLDMDDEYIFLGDTPDSIKFIVNRSTVAFIEITEEVNPLNELLKSLPDDVDPSKMN